MLPPNSRLHNVLASCNLFQLIYIPFHHWSRKSSPVCDVIVNPQRYKARFRTASRSVFDIPLLSSGLHKSSALDPFEWSEPGPNISVCNLARMGFPHTQIPLYLLDLLAVLCYTEEWNGMHIGKSLFWNSTTSIYTPKLPNTFLSIKYDVIAHSSLQTL